MWDVAAMTVDNHRQIQSLVPQFMVPATTIHTNKPQSEISREHVRGFAITKIIRHGFGNLRRP